MTNDGTKGHTKYQRYTKLKSILQNEYHWNRLIEEIPNLKELCNNINSVPSYLINNEIITSFGSVLALTLTSR